MFSRVSLSSKVVRHSQNGRHFFSDESPARKWATINRVLDRPSFSRRPIAEPWKIKTVEPIRVISQEEREECIRNAHYNTFLLNSQDVYIDLLTDSGTNAMSDHQWAALQLGDEAYAGSKNFYDLADTIQEHYGFSYVVPTHQGRGAEHILSQTLIQQGDFVPGNMYFTTTRLHQELAGGTFVDIICDEAHDPHSREKFKGNIDLRKLESLVSKVGADKIPYVCIQATVNMAGGQPISMANLQSVSEFCRSKGIKMFMDATRAVENAYFIKLYEESYASKDLKGILFEMCSLTDGCTMSGKKDPLVNAGGWLACNDEDLYGKFCEMVVMFEGLHTYGGMAGRDMAAMAQGIRESVDCDYMGSRIGQVHYLGQLLLQNGIPCIQPFGGHAIFLIASDILEHIPQDQFPAQTLAAELYLDAGVRSMERGIVSAGRNKETGDHNRPKLELVRLTIPRRVYTQAHMDFVAYSVVNVFNNRNNIKGLKFTYEPENLRFFLGRFDRA